MKFQLIRYASTLAESFKLHTVYRGTGLPEKRIGDSSKMVGIFATSKREYAEVYGDNIGTYAVAPDTKILDYNLSAAKSQARDIVRRFLVDGGRMTSTRFDVDPRNAMAMLFMMPTEEFIDYLKSLKFDAVRMNASNTDEDEILVLNTSKFKKQEMTSE